MAKSEGREGEGGGKGREEEEEERIFYSLCQERGEKVRVEEEKKEREKKENEKKEEKKKTFSEDMVNTFTNKFYCQRRRR